MRKSGAADISYDFEVISKEWSLAGRRMGHPSTHACVVAECGSMAFVALRTVGGVRPVCFRHYTLLDASSDIAQ